MHPWQMNLVHIFGS